ncbi:MAG: hypothetical protein M3R17_03180 [Bacteroidota bacterium]|nr:hypothetical protein [Bacteroidota bacterium]
MKKMILPVMTFALFAISCKKTDLPSTPVTSDAPAINSATNRKFVDFNYFIARDAETGEYSCPTPKVDCSKIGPNPTGLAAIDEAISNNAVTAFFNTQGWEEAFPYLADQQQAVSGLKNGNYTMVRKTNTAGDIFYIIIGADEDRGNFTSTIYTTMVENN